MEKRKVENEDYEVHDEDIESIKNGVR